jgi:hypothetical protein
VINQRLWQLSVPTAAARLAMLNRQLGGLALCIKTDGYNFPSPSSSRPQPPTTLHLWTTSWKSSRLCRRRSRARRTLVLKALSTDLPTGAMPRASRAHAVRRTLVQRVKLAAELSAGTEWGACTTGFGKLKKPFSNLICAVMFERGQPCFVGWL